MAGQLNRVASSVWERVYNGHSTPVPPFGVMKSNGLDDDKVYIVTRPDAASLTEVFLNGDTPIAPGEYGEGTRTEPCTCLIETADGTPAQGNNYGTQSGSWKLKKGNTGFRVIGASTNDNTAEMTFFGTGFKNLIVSTSGIDVVTDTREINFTFSGGPGSPVAVTDQGNGEVKVELFDAAHDRTGFVNQQVQKFSGIKTFYQGLIISPAYPSNAGAGFVVDASATTLTITINDFFHGGGAQTVGAILQVVPGAITNGAVYCKLKTVIGSTGEPCYVVSKGTTDFPGVWGTMPDGSLVSGGLITSIGSGAYTDEQAQDAVGVMVADTDTVNVTYTDATPELKWDVRYQRSITADASGLMLVNDETSPGNSKFYCTSTGGTKSWRVIDGGDLPAASDTAQGALEIAVQSEMETASSNTLAVTPGRLHFHPSAVKTWVMFNAAGNIGASRNVDSITDNGTGDFTVTFGTDFSSSAYVPMGCCEFASTSVVNVWLSVQNGGRAAGSCNVITGNSATGLQDPAQTFVGFLGDFA